MSSTTLVGRTASFMELLLLRHWRALHPSEVGADRGARFVSLILMFLKSFHLGMLRSRRHIRIFGPRCTEIVKTWLVGTLTKSQDRKIPCKSNNKFPSFHISRYKDIQSSEFKGSSFQGRPHASAKISRSQILRHKISRQLWCMGLASHVCWWRGPQAPERLVSRRGGRPGEGVLFQYVLISGGHLVASAALAGCPWGVFYSA
jgi:hypothetical protein